MTDFTPQNPDYAAFVADYVKAQGFLSLLGVRLHAVAPGQVEYRIAYRDDLGQHTGFFHGGAIGGVAEAVMGAAAASLVPKGTAIVGAEYKLNFLSPAKGPEIKAVGTVLKPGRTLSVCRAEISVIQPDGSEKLVAAAQGAMASVAGGA
jgi:uncharacterized protein (TIGR00369 family)